MTTDLLSLSDFEELARLAELTENKRVKEFLLGLNPKTKEQKQASAESAASASSSSLPAPISVDHHRAPQKRVEKLSKYYYSDQYGAEKVTLYVELAGIGAAKEAVEVKFGSFSCSVRVNSFQGKDYALNLDSLKEEIIPSSSSFRVKKDKIIVNLAKKDKNNHWMKLIGDPNKRKRDTSSSENPMAGIQDLLKDMYEEGDDATREAIGKAMYESRTKGAQGMAGI